MQFTEGIKNNAAAGVLLADVGAMLYEHHLVPVSILLSGQGSVIAELQLRNAANSANVFSQIIIVPALGTVNFHIPTPMKVLVGQRLRIVTFAAVTGQCQASLFVGDFDPNP